MHSFTTSKTSLMKRVSVPDSEFCSTATGGMGLKHKSLIYELKAGSMLWIQQNNSKGK